MKLVRLVNASVSANAGEVAYDHAARNFGLGNLILASEQNKSGNPVTQVTGFKLETLQRVSGWRKDRREDYVAFDGRHYPSLRVEIAAELAISVIQRAFPGIEVEEIDCATRDREQFPDDELEDLIGDDEDFPYDGRMDEADNWDEID